MDSPERPEWSGIRHPLRLLRARAGSEADPIQTLLVILESAMQRIFLKILAITLLANVAAYGQSLGEIAREYKEKQNAEESTGAKPKVITNKDLGEGPEGSPWAARVATPEPRPAADANPFARRSSEFAPGSGQQRGQEQRGGEQWRNQILDLENRIASAQARIDQMNASMRSNGMNGRYQARQAERVAQMQQQVDEQKRRLEQMQDAARHAGMHTQVYDP
jgi:hypothetical protein